jgi:hypothetical protein
VSLIVRAFGRLSQKVLIGCSSVKPTCASSTEAVTVYEPPIEVAEAVTEARPLARMTDESSVQPFRSV